MKTETRKRMIDFFILLLFGLLCFCLIKKLFFIVFPIGLGFLFSEAIRKSFSHLKPVSPAIRKVLIILTLLIFFAFLSLVMILFSEKAFQSITRLSTLLTNHFDDISLFVQNLITQAEEKIGRILHRSFENTFSDYFLSFLSAQAKALISRLPEWIGDILAFIPRFFVSLVIFLISTYYFSCDWENISKGTFRLFSEEKVKKIRVVKQDFLFALKKYLQAYLLLFLMTFAQLFLGLILLKIPNAFIIGLLIALIDILPVFGSGTVLIPWFVFAFLSGRVGLGAGLLVLYLIIFVVRQIAEPKIVGSSIGLHPVLSLVLVLGGLVLFGVFGMILVPLFVTCLIQSIKKTPSQLS